MTEEPKRRRRGKAAETPATEPTPETVADTGDAGTGADGRPLSRSDNEPPAEPKEPDVSGVARDQLRAFIERIERLEEEKQTVADDIKDVYGELKGVGFDAKIVREIIKLRKQDADERAEHDAVLDTYKQALGMISLPDGEYD